MSNSSDSTHTISYENRGIKFLVGLCALYVIVRLLWTGWFGDFNYLLLSAVDKDSTPRLEYGGVSLLIQLLLEIIIALGGALAFVVSGLWGVLVEFLRDRKAHKRARMEAENQARRAALVGASGQAGAAAGTAAAAASHDVPDRSMEDALKSMNPAVKKILKRHEHEIEELQIQVGLKQAPPPPPKTPEQIAQENAEIMARMRQEMDELRSQLAHAEAQKVPVQTPPEVRAEVVVDPDLPPELQSIGSK